MLIATFAPSTGWVGKKIITVGDAFFLEDFGPVTAQDVMEYDRQGHLVWANAGTRAWVGSQAATVPTPHGAGSPTTPRITTTAKPQTSQSRLLGDKKPLRRVLLVIGALLLVIVVIGVVAALVIPVVLQHSGRSAEQTAMKTYISGLRPGLQSYVDSVLASREASKSDVRIPANSAARSD